MNTLTKFGSLGICTSLWLSVASYACAQNYTGTLQPDYPAYSYNGINQNPWFNNSGIRQELDWSNTQFQQMNQNYGQIWDRYSRQLQNPYGDLSDVQRMQRQQDLYGAFNNDFAEARNGIFTDSGAKRRYDQMYLQYRGYGAFNDPSVIRDLNLSPEQRQRFNQLDREWNNNMSVLHREYQIDPNLAQRQFNIARTQYLQDLQQNLTPQQQLNWKTLSGRPYTFTPENYFQSDVGVGGNSTNPATGTNAPSTNNNPPLTTNPK